eukprot:2758351-Rhodomonas_salina.3
MLSVEDFVNMEGPVGRNACLIPSMVGAGRLISTSSANDVSPMTPCSFSFLPVRFRMKVSSVTTCPWLAESIHVQVRPQRREDKKMRNVAGLVLPMSTSIGVMEAEHESDSSLSRPDTQSSLMM